MKGDRRYRWIIRAVSHYVSFFLLVAFTVTCCMTLFLSIFSHQFGITLDSGNISLAAKVTFCNVVAISLLFTLIDALRRKITVDRRVKHISDATEKMIAGDFSVRVPKVSKLISDDRFNEIIDSINKMAEELSGVETLRADFIANVSHEMKTPLAVISNYATLLENEDIDSATRTEYARAIGSAARRLSDMITNILKLTRLENQQIYPLTEKFNLSEQLCECLLGYEQEWEKKGIEINADIIEDVYISSDRELVSLVWNNLLSNAFKFTDNGGAVSISLAADNEYVTVRVEDTGCGMTPEVGEHIFEKFYQADTSRATRGNGLGLALVKRVIDIVRADISVESEPNVGTVFTVRLWRGINEDKE